jgi:prolyl-tRNA editing enzyme YbaK/EbsC (Cys-tRNA(Pro) deacylase)
VAADAASREIPIEIIERPPASSLEDAAAMLGVHPSVVVKTLVVKRSDGTFLFALVPGDRQISWPKLRALVGVNKLQLPDAALALIGHGFTGLINDKLFVFRADAGGGYGFTALCQIRRELFFVGNRYTR